MFAETEVVLCGVRRFIAKKPVMPAHAVQLQTVCALAEYSVKDQYAALSSSVDKERGYPTYAVQYTESGFYAADAAFLLLCGVRRLIVVITGMKKRSKIAIFFGVLALVAAVLVYVYQYEGEIAVEFGNSEEARAAFTALLTEHDISYQIKTDHIGRVWIVPDQSKRKEYEIVNQIWDQRRKEEVRQLNEADRL